MLDKGTKALICIMRLGLKMPYNRIAKTACVNINTVCFQVNELTKFKDPNSENNITITRNSKINDDFTCGDQFICS
jgi:hypothetical protein